MYGRSRELRLAKRQALYRSRVAGELCSSGGSATHQSAEGRQSGEESCLDPYMSCRGPTETQQLWQDWSRLRETTGRTPKGGRVGRPQSGLGKRNGIGARNVRLRHEVRRGAVTSTKPGEDRLVKR
jgi:hypothetical protein